MSAVCSIWRAKNPSRREAATVTNLLFIPLIIIGIRGGLDESTTNIGQVYFSQDQFLNHSAVNPVFSFLSSFEKTDSLPTTTDLKAIGTK